MARYHPAGTTYPSLHVFFLLLFVSVAIEHLFLNLEQYTVLGQFNLSYGFFRWISSPWLCCVLEDEREEYEFEDASKQEKMLKDIMLWYFFHLTLCGIYFFFYHARYIFNLSLLITRMVHPR